MTREGGPACLLSASFNRQPAKEEARELKTNKQFGVSCSRRCCRRPCILLLSGATYSRNDGFQWCMDRKPIGLEPYRPLFLGFTLMALLLAGFSIFRRAKDCDIDDTCSTPRTR